MRFILLAFTLTLASVHSLQGQIYYSAQDGYWSSPGTWQNGQVPDLSDSVQIDHYVTYEHDLNIPSTGYILVSRSGVLCGVHDIEAACGSWFFNYGTVKAKNLWLTDGSNYGFFRLLLSYHVLPCQTTFAIGAAHLGGSFTCATPVSVQGIEEGENIISLFPNPTTGRFVIKYHDKTPTRLQVLNLAGQIVWENDNFHEGSTVIDISGKSNGVYIARIAFEDGEIKQFRVIKED